MVDVTKDAAPRRGGFWRGLGGALQEPAVLFAVLTALLMFVSALVAGSSVTNPATGEVVTSIDLLSVENVRRIFTDLPAIFSAFPPLATVLIVMLGVGVAEKSGLLAAALSGLARAVPRQFLTAVVVFAGVNASIASDAGYVVLIPLGAALFAAAGRHPLVGLAATFSGVAGGFTANVSLTSLDALLVGITQPAARILVPEYELPITANYYLMVALVPAYTLAGVLVTELFADRWINRRFPGFERPAPPPESEAERRAAGRGLLYAGLALAAVLAFVLALYFGGILSVAGPTGEADATPLFRGMVAIMALTFFAVGVAYGAGAGTVRSVADATGMMARAMADMGPYLVLVFFAALFIDQFTQSKLGVVLAVEGAQGLNAAGLPAWAILLGMIVIVGVLDLFVGSASAKWAVLAPVLVPMLMLMGVSPAATQAAYRVGDSATNQIAPLLPYLPLILITARRYVPRLGIPGLIGTMLPYAAAYWVVGVVTLFAWFASGLELGPGAGPAFIDPPAAAALAPGAPPLGP